MRVAGRKGFTLLEMLVALTLAAIALPLLCQLFYQGARHSKKIRERLEERRAGHRVLTRIEKDLKNAVSFSRTPFVGVPGKLSFASLDAEIRKVTYEKRDGRILRKEESLAVDTAQDLLSPAAVASMAEGVNAWEVEYAYGAPGGETVFLPHWSERRLGIPKAVRMRIFFEGRESPASLFLMLPQGSLGVMEE